MGIERTEPLFQARLHRRPLVVQNREIRAVATEAIGKDAMLPQPARCGPEGGTVAVSALISAATCGRPRHWRDRLEGAASTIYRSTDGGTHWEPSMEGLALALLA